MKSAFAKEQDPKACAAALARQFGALEPKAIVFFVGPKLDGAVLSAELRARYPGAEVIGCTTAGEFTQSFSGLDSATAIAFDASTIQRCVGALALSAGGASEGVRRATEGMARALNADLRELDPAKWVGVVLVEGLRGKEEKVNEALGDAAPQLSFVGGSAGDNALFQSTRVFHNGKATEDGAALLLMEAARPFTIAKSCSFKPSGKVFKVTRADERNRVIYEFDGRPVLEAYAEAVGVKPAQLDGQVFMSHPVGLMIDGQPWIRSPQQALKDGGLKFYCEIREGVEVHLMSSTDLIGETRAALEATRRQLGGKLSGGLTFNCILRRLELDAKNLHQPFLDSFQGMETAGFHTYGESYLGHINQTLTALLFG